MITCALCQKEIDTNEEWVKATTRQGDNDYGYTEYHSECFNTMLRFAQAAHDMTRR